MTKSLNPTRYTPLFFGYSGAVINSTSLFNVVLFKKQYFFFKKEYIEYNGKKYFSFIDFEDSVEVLFDIISKIENKGYEFYIFRNEILVRVEDSHHHLVPPIEFRITLHTHFDRFINGRFNKVEAIKIAIELFALKYNGYIQPTPNA